MEHRHMPVSAGRAGQQSRGGGAEGLQSDHKHSQVQQVGASTAEETLRESEQDQGHAEMPRYPGEDCADAGRRETVEAEEAQRPCDVPEHHIAKEIQGKGVREIAAVGTPTSSTKVDGRGADVGSASVLTRDDEALAAIESSATAAAVQAQIPSRNAVNKVVPFLRNMNPCTLRLRVLKPVCVTM